MSVPGLMGWIELGRGVVCFQGSIVKVGGIEGEVVMGMSFMLWSHESYS